MVFLSCHVDREDIKMSISSDHHLLQPISVLFKVRKCIQLKYSPVKISRFGACRSETELTDGSLT